MRAVWHSAALKHFASQEIIEQGATAHHGTEEIHTQDARNQNAWLMKSVPKFLHAKMKNVLIRAIAQSTQIV